MKMIDGKKFVEDIYSHVELTDFQIVQIGKLYDKQPKTDWIPCEAELPPMPKENPLFENKPIELYLVSLGYADYPIRAFWNGKIFTDGWGKLKVEAWMPLPQPYKKEGAENE